MPKEATRQGGSGEAWPDEEGGEKPLRGFRLLRHPKQETEHIVRGRHQTIVATMWNCFQGRKGPGIQEDYFGGEGVSFKAIL